MAARRLVFVVNHVAFFVSHRLPLAIAARERGWEVFLITGQAGSPTMEAQAVARLQEAALPHLRLAFKTAGLNPFPELRGVVQLVRSIRRLGPAIVHTASPKGGLYGGLGSRIARVPGLVFAVSGMGFLFTGKAGFARKALGHVYSALLRHVYGHPNKTIIVQNSDDRDLLIQQRWAADAEVVLIPGSGVDLGLYLQIQPVQAQRVVLLPARMLRDKGVREFVGAARRLRQRGVDWRFVLVGAADYANPTAIPRARIEAWLAEGAVEWWGHRDDMLTVYAQAGIVCLPSYREGMPKCLLEAAAAGRPVVTTDVTGCREAIIPGTTGDVVAVRDEEALADALLALINDPERRRRYGENGRNLAMERFGIDTVIQAHLDIYERLYRHLGQAHV